jgi:hypothetical protein
MHEINAPEVSSLILSTYSLDLDGESLTKEGIKFISKVHELIDKSQNPDQNKCRSSRLLVYIELC